MVGTVVAGTIEVGAADVVDASGLASVTSPSAHAGTSPAQTARITAFRTAPGRTDERVEATGQGYR